MLPIDLFPESGTWCEIKLIDHAEEIIKPRRGEHWLPNLEQQYGGSVYGGYLEDRSPFFDTKSGESIHLGLDVWAPEGTQVHFPFAGKVLNNSPSDDVVGGWGGRLDILCGDNVFILGHLSEPTFSPGDSIEPGQAVGTLAPMLLNGGWQPHLHVQCVKQSVYDSFPNHRDVDAYAPACEQLASDYPDPRTVSADNLLLLEGRSCSVWDKTLQFLRGGLLPMVA